MRAVLLTLALAACAEAPAPAQAPAPEQAPAAEEAVAEEVAADEEAEPAEAVAEPDAEGWRTYGEAFTVDSAIDAATLFADPAAKAGQVVRVEGRVADVCQKAGCWMVLAHEDQIMRVRMKDHGFSVDKQGTGGHCDIEGELVEKTVDADEAAHFASEAGNPDALPEKGQDKVYEIIAHSVRMKRSS